MDTYATVGTMPESMDPYESEDHAKPDDLLTSAAVTRIAHISKSTLRRAVKAGRLVPLRTPGGHFRFRRSDVEALMGIEASA